MNYYPVCEDGNIITNEKLTINAPKLPEINARKWQFVGQFTLFTPDDAINITHSIFSMTVLCIIQQNYVTL